MALSNAWQGQQPALLLLLLCAAACLPQQNDGGGGGSVPSLAAASMALTLLGVSRILLGLLLAYSAQTAAQLATLCCLSLMLPAAYAQEVTILGDGTIVCGASEPLNACADGLSCPVGTSAIPGAMCSTCMCSSVDIDLCCEANGVDPTAVACAGPHGNGSPDPAQRFNMTCEQMNLGTGDWTSPKDCATGLIRQRGVCGTYCGVCDDAGGGGGGGELRSPPQLASANGAPTARGSLTVVAGALAATAAAAAAVVP